MEQKLKISVMVDDQILDATPQVGAKVMVIFEPDQLVRESQTDEGIQFEDGVYTLHKLVLKSVVDEFLV